MSQIVLPDDATGQVAIEVDVRFVLQGLLVPERDEYKAIREGLVEPTTLVVQWSFDGRYDSSREGGSFPNLGGPATAVTVHGVSLATLRGAAPIDPDRAYLLDEWAIQRYVDWMGVYTQLGLSLTWRRAVDDEPIAQPEP